MKIIIYKENDTTKKIIPAPGYDAENLLHQVPKGCEYKIVDSSELPDRTFRNAWDIKDGKVVEDIDKAKEIHKEKLRQDRKTLLEELDNEVMQNITDSEKILEIEKKKQPLRDITTLVDACKTIDEIKKIKV